MKSAFTAAVLLLAAAFSAASGPKQNTLDVMKEFYGSLGGGEWTNRANWTATDNYCLFYGVACDLDYNVVSISIVNNNLVGELPATLAQLPLLSNLVLAGNSISGTVAFLSEIPSLLYVDLTDNRLTGPLPKLGNITALQQLRLSNNYLSGELPTALPKYLFVVQIFNNHLSGAVPPSVSGAPRLQTLSLSNNSLSGNITNNFQPALEYLDLSHNSLGGKFPSTLATNCPHLKFLDLSYNRMTGNVTNAINNLRNLDPTHCLLNHNDLNCPPYSMPSSCGVHYFPQGNCSFSAPAPAWTLP